MNDNNLRELVLLRPHVATSTFTAPRAIRRRFRASPPQRSPTQPHSDVHLVPCSEPKGELDRAPRSSLSENSASETWDGFWCDDRYYTRRTRRDGSVRWFTIVDARPKILAFVPRGSAR